MDRPWFRGGQEGDRGDPSGVDEGCPSGFGRRPLGRRGSGQRPGRQGQSAAGAEHGQGLRHGGRPGVRRRAACGAGLGPAERLEQRQGAARCVETGSGAGGYRRCRVGRGDGQGRRCGRRATRSATDTAAAAGCEHRTGRTVVEVAEPEGPRAADRRASRRVGQSQRNSRGCARHDQPAGAHRRPQPDQRHRDAARRYGRSGAGQPGLLRTVRRRRHALPECAEGSRGHEPSARRRPRSVPSAARHAVEIRTARRPRPGPGRDRDRQPGLRRQHDGDRAGHREQCERRLAQRRPQRRHEPVGPGGGGRSEQHPRGDLVDGLRRAGRLHRYRASRTRIWLARAATYWPPTSTACGPPIRTLRST